MGCLRLAYKRNDTTLKVAYSVYGKSQNNCTGAYRYGFNGKEKDDEETVGTGSGTQDYGMRIYNPSLGKFLSVDPVSNEYPWNSTYAFAENDVIRSIDLEGAEKNVMIYHWYGDQGYVLAFNGPPTEDATVAQVAKKVVLSTGLNPDGTLVLFQKDLKTNARTNPDETVQTSLTVSYDFQYIAKNKSGELEDQRGETSFITQETDAIGLNIVSDVRAIINIKNSFKSKNEGIVYKRTDKTGKEKDYVGQAKSEERYLKRQQEHKRKNKDADYEFEVIDNGKPGYDLNSKEQKHIDAGGGPTNKSNPNGGLSNKKNVIKKDK